MFYTRFTALIFQSSLHFEILGFPSAQENRHNLRRVCQASMTEELQLRSDPVKALNLHAVDSGLAISTSQIFERKSRDGLKRYRELFLARAGQPVRTARCMLFSKLYLFKQHRDLESANPTRDALFTLGGS